MAEQPSQENQLFKSLVTGGEAVLEQIYQLYFSRLAAYSFEILGDELLAKEAAQDTLYILWLHRQEMATIAMPESWLYKCACHRSLNILKREQRKASNADAEATEVADDHVIHDEIDSHDLSLLVQKAIEQLPPGQRKVFLLIRQEGWTRKEVAEHFGLSEHSVKNHMSMAQKNLRRLVKGFLHSFLI